MRVLMVTNMLPHAEDPSYGVFVGEQARALREAGVDLELLFVNGRATRWNYLLAYPRFWRRIARRHFDLVHAHYVFSGLIARAQFHLPLVQSFHAPGLLHTYQGFLCRHLLPHVQAAIVTNADHRAGLGNPAAHVIPCGVNLDRFFPGSRDEARDRLGWPRDRAVLVWVGEPRPEKRVDLVRAVHERLKPQRPDLDLRIVSRVPHDQIADVLRASDVLLFPSDHEGAPVVIKEAMACNLPIVATPVGDIPRLFLGVRGCRLSPQDPDALAENVRPLLESGERSEGFAVVRPFDVRNEAAQIIAIYENVLGRKLARPEAAPVRHTTAA